MTSSDRQPKLYEQLAPIIYDWGAAAAFYPLGGLNLLRRQALDEFDIRPGIVVLELGCGTGGLTAMMLHRGATVIAVDQSEGMLRRARRRAPAATFIRSDILAFDCGRKFDRVLLAFVLHHMEADARLTTLELVRTFLKPGGSVGILDWTQPDSATLSWVLHALLTTVEPSSALDFIQQRMETCLEQVGLVLIRNTTLAKGVAKFVAASTR